MNKKYLFAAVFIAGLLFLALPSFALFDRKIMIWDVNIVGGDSNVSWVDLNNTFVKIEDSNNVGWLDYTTIANPPWGAGGSGLVTRIIAGFGIDVNSNVGDVNVSVDVADLNTLVGDYGTTQGWGAGYSGYVPTEGDIDANAALVFDSNSFGSSDFNRAYCTNLDLNANFVPYFGASSDVNLGEYDFNARDITLGRDADGVSFVKIGTSGAGGIVYADQLWGTQAQETSTPSMDLAQGQFFDSLSNLSMDWSNRTLEGSWTTTENFTAGGFCWDAENCFSTLPTFGELADTEFSGLSENQSVKWNGSAWVNDNFPVAIAQAAVQDMLGEPPDTCDAGDRFLVVPSTPSNWYSSDWDFRQVVTAKKTAAQGTNVAYPFYLYLDDADNNLFADAKTDGSDIVLTQADGITQKKYELEYYHPEGYLLMWEKENDYNSSLDSNSYIYYGNPDTTFSNSTDTWDENASQVFHFASSDGSNRTYSSKVTSQYCTLSSGAYITTFGNGIIGKAAYFDGTNDYCTVSTDYTYSVFSISVKFNTSMSPPTATPRTLVARYYTSPANLGSGIFLRQDGNLLFRTKNSAGTLFDIVSNVAVNNGHNHQADLTIGADLNMIAYLDGNVIGNTTISGAITGTGGDTRIAGVTLTGSGYFNGKIDEFRFEKTVRDANWIKTRWNNENNPTAAVEFVPDTENSAGGAWAGHEQEIATSVDACPTENWTFEAPDIGWLVWVIQDGEQRTYDGESWVLSLGNQSHNYLLGLDGGETGYYGHLTAQQRAFTASAAAAATGVCVKTDANTVVPRTITGTANQITVTNGNGVSGNPTLSFPTKVVFPDDINAHDANFSGELRGERIAFVFTNDTNTNRDHNLTVNGIPNDGLRGISVMRSGSLTGLSADFNCTGAVAASNNKYNIYVNGALKFGTATIATTSTGIKTGYVTQTRGAYTFNAGDVIMVASDNTNSPYYEDEIVLVEAYFDT